MNYSEYFSLEDADKTVEIVSDGNVVQTEDETIVEFDINNNMQEETDTVVIVAFYDDKGKLMAVNTERVAIPSGEYTYNRTFAKNTRETKNVKFMIWASGQDMFPLCRLKNFEI